MRQHHVAGDKVFVDYSGKRIAIVEPGTGVVHDAEIFVGVGPKGSICRESGPPSRAAITSATRHAHFVPIPAVSRCSKSYSITSSARSRNDSGTVRPSALAVVRLMTSSNLVGCSTGISADFAPRRILSTKSAVRRNRTG
jgi:transposase